MEGSIQAPWASTLYQNHCILLDTSYSHCVCRKMIATSQQVKTDMKSILLKWVFPLRTTMLIA